MLSHSDHPAPPESPEIPESSLTKRAAKASMWVMVIRVFQHVISFGRIAVLARLLSPDDFGLMGIAFSIVVIVNLFSDTGFRSALVQKSGDISKSLNTAWTVDLLRQTAIAIVLIASAPMLARIFDVPESTQIIRVVSLELVILGFVNIGTVYLKKNLQTRDELVMRMGGTVVDTTVAISLAIILGSAWALVWGSLAGATAFTVLSYTVSPHIPRLELKRTELSWMFAFGKWMTMGKLASAAVTQVDRLVIVRVLGVGALGLYSVGGRVSLSLVTEISEVGFRVLFPALSKLQSSPERLRRYSIGMIELGSALVAPFSVVVAIFAEEMVTSILGPSWTSAIGITQILALVAIPMSIVHLMVLPLQSAGHPGSAARSNIVPLLIIGLGVIPVSNQWSLEGVGWLVFAGYALGIMPLAITWNRKLGVAPLQLLAALQYGLIISLLISGPVLLIKSGGMSDVITLSIGGLTATLFYCAITYGLWRLFGKGPVALLVQFRTRAE